MESNNPRPEGQQELGSSMTVHGIFGFLIILLLTLLQVNYQNSGNPFETHGATMLLFILAVFVYAIALAGISQPTPNSSYLPILRVTPTDSPVLSTNFPIDQSVYLSSIQNIEWLVPK
uniref:Uncharacterized protein n=1 Tax=Quercus lobata TaxID=97700 RepID=A0A7N2M2Q7_QUELO